MQSSRLAGSKAGPPVQKYLDISEIRENCLVLKDGTLRAVLLVSSVNFALKSMEEQNALIASYVSFLNSLEFPIQIVIQSRKLDIEGYLEKLKSIEKEQINELLRIQIADYRQYVGELVEMGDIMSKHFYLVIPYNPLSDKKKNFFSRVKEIFTPGITIRLGEEKFQRNKKELIQRLEHVNMSLSSMGLRAAPLDTQGLIELYYNIYNPTVSKKEKMENLSKLRVEE